MLKNDSEDYLELRLRIIEKSLVISSIDDSLPWKLNCFVIM